ncbi:lytic transglycosylase domain-containing protein [Rubrivirga sp.]|uniref:lytic transglycosylase domain-containing protein n=1 Tax=Rubrivirga sp. TaxID=1885344 RepID=UPI003C74F7C0
MFSVRLGLAVLLSLSAFPALAAAPPDSTEITPMDWVREVVRVRHAIEAVEDASPIAQPDLAAVALEDALALAAHPLSDGSVRDLVVQAQAVYEPHHGPVSMGPLSALEVTEIRGPMLAALDNNFAPPLESPAVAAARRAALAAEADRAQGPDWLFYPAASAPLVERQRRSARRLAQTGRRGRRTLRQIERTLARRGLPTDLQYVAVIESALNPRAESWAGARGLWQFMPETAAEFGLDSLTVEDPAASTEAAARYLRQLARMFEGDYQLALAAYNAGPGRVRRLMREHEAETGKKPTFWELHDALPRETRQYVPRFIAVAEALGARG